MYYGQFDATKERYTRDEKISLLIGGLAVGLILLLASYLGGVSVQP
jgi:hypothetical protein